MKCYHYASSKNDHKTHCKPKHKEKSHCKKCENNFKINLFGISINIGGKGHC